jgi:hypothetical protein
MDQLKALRAALEWMLNLASGVGKAGGGPEPDEYDAACDSANAALRGDDDEASGTPPDPTWEEEN